MPTTWGGAQSSTSPLLAMPSEILRAMIQLLVATPSQVKAGKGLGDSYGALWSLCLTSRLLDEIARPVLYTHVSLGSIDRLLRFFRTMLEAPRLRSHVCILASNHGITGARRVLPQTSTVFRLPVPLPPPAPGPASGPFAQILAECFDALAGSQERGDAIVRRALGWDGLERGAELGEIRPYASLLLWMLKNLKEAHLCGLDIWCGHRLDAIHLMGGHGPAAGGVEAFKHLEAFSVRWIHMFTNQSRTLLDFIAQSAPKLRRVDLTQDRSDWSGPQILEGIIFRSVTALSYDGRPSDPEYITLEKLSRSFPNLRALEAQIVRDLSDLRPDDGSLVSNEQARRFEGWCGQLEKVSLTTEHNQLLPCALGLSMDLHKLLGAMKGLRSLTIDSGVLLMRYGEKEEGWIQSDWQSWEGMKFVAARLPASLMDLTVTANWGAQTPGGHLRETFVGPSPRPMPWGHTSGYITALPVEWAASRLRFIEDFVRAARQHLRPHCPRLARVTVVADSFPSEWHLDEGKRRWNGVINLRRVYTGPGLRFDEAESEESFLGDHKAQADWADVRNCFGR